MFSEKELINGCAKGERAAQRELYNRNCRRLMAVCLRYAKSSPEAEDILQEAFVKIFNNLKTFRFESKLDTWMTRIVINTALNHQRQRLFWDLIGNKTKNAVFVQMSYGWAHPWFVKDGAYASYVTDPFSSVKGGKMINPQIGYRINYYDLKMSVAVGYKFQQIHFKKLGYYYPNCPQCDSQPLSYDEITQDMNRLQVVISVGWK